MNVAIFASAFYPHTGGVEELVRQLCHEYLQQGIAPVILTNRWPRSLPSYELYEGTPVYRLAMRMPDWNLRVRLTHHLTYPFTRWQMLRILRRHRSEVIHVQCASSNGYYALAAQKALGLPLVLSVQGERTMDAQSIYDRLPSLTLTLRELISRSTSVTACSKDTLADLEQWWGQPLGSKSSVMYNGIRLEDFEQAEPYAHPRPYVFAIGRLVKQKGFDVLIRAFAEAGLASHDLLFAGEGPEHAALSQLAETIGMKDRVHFLGRADRPKTVALFKGCSFFVLPSRMEPFGIVNLEAMAAGKAIIASRVGGVPEVILDGETGILVPPEDVGAVASALRRLADDPTLRERLAKNGRQRVLAFTWPKIARSFHSLYSDAVTGKSGGLPRITPTNASGAYA